MRRLLPLIWCIAAVFILSGRPAAAGQHPWTNKRIYYVVEYLGRVQEKGFFVRRPGSFQKEPCVVVEEERFFFAENDHANPTRAVRVKTLTTPDGIALQRHEEVVVGEPGREVITLADGRANFEAAGYFGASDAIDVPEGVVFEVTGEWLAAHNPRRGRTFEVEVLDRMGRGVFTERVEILERLSENSWDIPLVWLAEFNSPGRPPMQVRFTSDGRLLRMDAEGLSYQVVSRADYELGRIPEPEPEPAVAGGPAGESAREYPEGYLLDSSQPGDSGAGTPAIPVGEAVPAWDNFAWLVFQGVPPGEWQNVVGPSEYCRVDFNGVVTGITAMRNAPRVDAGAVFPMAVPADVQAYLAPADAIPVVNRMIIDAAYMAVADASTRREETNVLKAVSYLAGWINQNVAVQDWNGYRSNAIDTLVRRAGDSVGHARLFAAMARTLGIPTRICQGFITHSGQAVFHCWAEAWINGVWMPVDTTVSRVGLPAGYVMAERSGPDGLFALDFAGFMRNPQNRLGLVSAGRETPSRQQAELVIGDRRTYAFSDGDWMANLYWGFALRLPPSWTGSAKLNSVELSSNDRRASVKCEALAGDYKAGNAELESNIDSLRTNLARFGVIDSRIVSFDPEGATPALFIDFTCLQNGVNLRCRQYLLPRRYRAFRISFWAPAEQFNSYAAQFDSILASFEF